MNGKKGVRLIRVGDVLIETPLRTVAEFGDCSELKCVPLLDYSRRAIENIYSADNALENRAGYYVLETSGIVDGNGPYYFDETNGPVTTSVVHSVFYKVLTNIVHPLYLLMELYEEYATKQYVLPMIREDYSITAKDAFLNTQIYIPEGDSDFSLYEQQRLFNEYRNKEIQRVLNKTGARVDGDSNLLPHTLLQKGRYTIEEHIDGGGFGKLYKATMKLPTHRQHVALKELFVKEYCTRRPLTNEVQTRQTEDFRRQQQKFRKEHDILAELSERTPYVPRVMSPVFAENHTLYYAMQFVENGTIWTHCRNNTLTQQELLTAICQAGIALHHAHDMDYLHFDVTPLNIMVDDSKHGILIDFGNSKHYSVDDDCITSVGQAAKTKSFASPELLHQTVSDYGMQADVYGLAVTLYAVLTGNVPYPRYTEEDTDYAKTIERNLRAQQVHPCVARTILRGISYKPKDRQSSVREFLQELLPALSGTDIAQEITELRPIKGFHPQNHKFSTAYIGSNDQLPNMESE